MSNLCIIPARGGSKRIPNKNIKLFLGKPILAYSIEAAQQSGLFDEIMVSTDSRDIAEIAQDYGAKVPFMRSGKTADDHATTMDVLKEVEATYRELQHKTFRHICCMYATAPFITTEHLKAGYKLLTEQELDAVYPVVAFSYPIWRGIRVTGEHHTEFIWPDHLNTRSQDLEPVYHDAGQWYWYNPSTIGNSLLAGNTGSLILPETEVQDIDTLTDFQLAELKYQLLLNRLKNV